MPRRGVEPPCLAAQDPKSCMSTIPPPGHEAILTVNLTYSYKVVKLPFNMPNQTLSPFSSQKTETRNDPSKAPGAMGWINETAELIAGGGGSFVNERPLTKQEFQDIQQPPERRAGMPVRGSIEFNQRLHQEITQISSARSKIDALKAKRQEVNTKIGIGNTSYEDTVREDFTLRVDVQTDLNKANSKLNEEQLKAKRETTIAQATGKVNRIAGADMKRDFEDRNMGGPG